MVVGLDGSSFQTGDGHAIDSRHFMFTETNEQFRKLGQDFLTACKTGAIG